MQLPLVYPYPTMHDVHFPVDAEQDEHVDEHEEHDDDPATEYVIDPHTLHLFFPAAAYVPAEH